MITDSLRVSKITTKQSGHHQTWPSHKDSLCSALHTFMAFTRNVNKPLSLSFGSYPISVERRGRILDADWIWAGADGAWNGARRPNCVRRHDSPQRFAQSRAASDHMLKTCYELCLWTSWTKAIVTGNRVVFNWKEGLSSSKKIFDPTVFNGKHADNIGL